jgi:hypothetical protein
MINLGMPRYFPALERIALEVEGVAYQPDLVLVGVLPNDVVDTHLGIDAAQVAYGGSLVSARAQQMGPWVAWACLHSALVRAIAARLIAAMDAATVPDEGDWAAMQADLESMAAISREHGARFAVIGIPQSNFMRNDELDRRLRAWSAEHTISYISVWPAMRAADGGAPLYGPDGHCTPAGYAVIAEAVFDGLEAQGVLRLHSRSGGRATPRMAAVRACSSSAGIPSEL